MRAFSMTLSMMIKMASNQRLRWDAGLVQYDPKRHYTQLVNSIDKLPWQQADIYAAYDWLLPTNKARAPWPMNFYLQSRDFCFRNRMIWLQQVECINSLRFADTFLFNIYISIISLIMSCSAAECVCAKKSTCSCGKQAALHCNCEKAPVENAVPPKENSCSCGKRVKGQCTCGNNDCASKEGEVDFTGTMWLINQGGLYNGLYNRIKPSG